MFKIALLQCFSEGGGSTVGLVECLAALNHVVVGVFGRILHLDFANDTSTFEEPFMGAMRTHNTRMTPKVCVLVRTGVQLVTS